MKTYVLTDVFDGDAGSLKRSVLSLKACGFGRPSDQVSAVYVAHQGEAQLVMGGADSGPSKDVAEKALAGRIQSAAGTRVRLNSEVVYDYTLSLKSSVDSLIQNAKKQGVELLVVASQARKGFARFLLGSFAETLIHRSPIDLLVLNPKVKPRPKTKRILLAVDLDRGSEKLVQEIAEMARGLSAELLLLHVPSPSYSVKFKGQDEAVVRYRATVNRQMKKLGEIASQLGAKVSTQIEGRWESISDVILREARKGKADLVVVKAKTGSLATLMLGSVARSVVRKSDAPVLVLRRR